jgi:hypothetical protein
MYRLKLTFVERTSPLSQSVLELALPDPFGVMEAVSNAGCGAAAWETMADDVKVSKTTIRIFNLMIRPRAKSLPVAMQRPEAEAEAGAEPRGRSPAAKTGRVKQWK